MANNKRSKVNPKNNKSVQNESYNAKFQEVEEVDDIDKFIDDDEDLRAPSCVIDDSSGRAHFFEKESLATRFTKERRDMIYSNIVATALWETPCSFDEEHHHDTLTILNMKYRMKDILQYTDRYNSKDLDTLRSMSYCEFFCLTYNGREAAIKCITNMNKDHSIQLSKETMEILSYIAAKKAYQYHGKNYNSISADESFPLIRACLEKIVSGSGYTPLPSPVIPFQRATKEGLYNDMSESEYSSCLAGYKNICRLFEDKAAELPLSILNNAMMNANLSENDIIDMSVTIARKLSGKICDNYIVNNMKYPHSSFGKTSCMDEFKQWTPKEIYELINKNVVHQDDAKKTAAMLVYNHIQGHGRNIIMAGPTGCGKTEIWRTLSETFPFIQIINGPQLSPESYKGDYKLSEIFMQYKHDPGKAEHLILVIDEADKIFEPQIGSSGTDFAKLIQNELLKIMDHSENSKVTFMSDNRHEPTTAMEIDCKGISVVLCGSFEHLIKTKDNMPSQIGFLPHNKTSNGKTIADKYSEHDFIDYANMRTELVGRINKITTLKGMTSDDFIYIMDHKTASPVKKIENELGVKLTINKAAKDQLAKYAADTKLGCRVIRSTILRHLDDEMFEDPTKDRYNLSKQILTEFK